MTGGISKFLAQLSRGDANTKIEYVGSVDNETRKGIYLKVKMGLTHDVWFVGVDPRNHKQVVEITGQ